MILLESLVGPTLGPNNTCQKVNTNIHKPAKNNSNKIQDKTNTTCTNPNCLHLDAPVHLSLGFSMVTKTRIRKQRKKRRRVPLSRCPPISLVNLPGDLVFRTGLTFLRISRRRILVASL
uniref:Uncharacterized protein LOC105631354 isoform X3 n=1 Tax=Rhizophora mucronata TaxID=61149 RepID=A0A2P2M4F8_RHIMU